MADLHSPSAAAASRTALRVAGDLWQDRHTVPQSTRGAPLRSAYVGPITDAEAAAITTRLRHLGDAGRATPEVPWAGAVTRADGSIAATCSTMLTSGLFWSTVRLSDGPTALVLGTDPASLVREAGAYIDFDRDYLTDFVQGHVATHHTPFSNIHRVPPGETLAWTPQSPQAVTLTTWCGPANLPEPQLDGPAAIAEFIRAVDGVVAGLAERTPELVAAISGGLDSTFVAASLAQVTPEDRAIHGFCHRPLGSPDASAYPGWDPDDWPWAQQFAAAYPDRVRLTALTNTAGVHPLDAAARTSDLAGLPSYSPHNQVWMNALTDHAVALGARVRFSGQHGNATFSNPHDYAARYYARRGDAVNLWGLVRDARERGQPLPGRVRRHLLAPLRHPTGFSRTDWLDFLTLRRLGNGAMLNPAAARGVLYADPYTSRSVMEVAAAITPREWRRGPKSRGFARRAGLGRVPDAIRLRTTRGGQSWDAPDQWRADPARAELAMNRLEDIPWLGGAATLTWARSVLDALFASPAGTGYAADLNRLSRLLGVAEFVHRWRLGQPHRRC